MREKLAVSFLLVVSHALFLFCGLMVTKKTFMPIASCNKRLGLMQDYYLNNIYAKYGLKEVKDERKNIKQYCMVN